MIGYVKKDINEVPCQYNSKWLHVELKITVDAFFILALCPDMAGYSAYIDIMFVKHY